MDRTHQKLLIRQVRPLGAPRTHAVEHKLDRIEDRRLPRPVDPAEQHDRPSPPRRLRRRQIQHLPALEEPEIAESQLLEDHEARYAFPHIAKGAGGSSLHDFPHLAKGGRGVSIALPELADATPFPTLQRGAGGDHRSTGAADATPFPTLQRGGRGGGRRITRHRVVCTFSPPCKWPFSQSVPPPH